MHLHSSLTSNTIIVTTMTVFVLLSASCLQCISAIPIQTDVQIDRLAQLVTSHYQYDHFDPLTNEYANALAKQLRFNDIHIAPDVEDPPTLQAQVIQAIQSHVANKLLSSAQPLPSLRDIIAQHCPPTTTTDDDNQEGMVEVSCLQRKAEQLSSDLDQFVESYYRTWILEKTEEALSVKKLDDRLVSLTVERSKQMQVSLHQSPCEFHRFTRFLSLAFL
ncbi:hypothetical protein BDB00DRAFT_815361 [Zychaea mexicana]|uniref:uncharacterized protein n=1 Tax=Zychaea mexicana TaxID=64656 RepID=UPI0022FE54D5|nr:uncharacterized protein BDB00DRAFT_815361 [Zychaea mexicana]KAI9495261.1 hypothetical protein BDB00DRAFT_815361 [Zychaea mexicana]